MASNIKRKEVIEGAGLGNDCSVINNFNDDELFVVTSDPITCSSFDVGKLAVHVNANDIAAGCAEPFGLVSTLLLPQNFSEDEAKNPVELLKKYASFNLEEQVIGEVIDEKK